MTCIVALVAGMLSLLAGYMVIRYGKFYSAARVPIVPIIHLERVVAHGSRQNGLLPKQETRLRIKEKLLGKVALGVPTTKYASRSLARQYLSVPFRYCCFRSSGRYKSASAFGTSLLGIGRFRDTASQILRPRFRAIEAVRNRVGRRMVNSYNKIGCLLVFLDRRRHRCHTARPKEGTVSQ